MRAVNPVSWCGGAVRLALLALILAIGLGLRLEQAIDPNNAPNFDSRAYAGIAAGLYRDGGFEQVPTSDQPVTQPSSNYSPGVPLLLGGSYYLTGGEHLTLARALLALASAAAALLAFALARRWAGPDAGLLAAAVVAIYPAMLEYSGMVTGEPLAATLVAAAVLTILWAAEKRSALAWLPAGGLLGATAMLRPEYLAVTCVLALGVAVWLGRSRGPRPGVTAALVLLGGMALVVAPWTIRNAITLDRFVPISTGGGQVLFAGNYLPSDGDPQRVQAELLARDADLRRRVGELTRERGGGPPYLEEVLAQLALRSHPELPPDQALGRLGREQLADNVTDHTGEYAVFVLRKVSRVWSQGPREVMERPGWRALHLLVVALAAVGLARLFRRRPPDAALIAALIVMATLTSALLGASPRRTLVLLPELAALAGIGTVWLVQWAQGRRRSAGAV